MTMHRPRPDFLFASWRDNFRALLAIEAQLLACLCRQLDVQAGDVIEYACSAGTARRLCIARVSLEFEAGHFADPLRIATAGPDPRLRLDGFTVTAAGQIHKRRLPRRIFSDRPFARVGRFDLAATSHAARPCGTMLAPRPPAGALA